METKTSPPATAPLPPKPPKAAPKIEVNVFAASAVFFLILIMLGAIVFLILRTPYSDEIYTNPNPKVGQPNYPQQGNNQIIKGPAPIVFNPTYNFDMPTESPAGTIKASVVKVAKDYANKWPMDYRIAVDICQSNGCYQGYDGAMIIDEGKAIIAVDINFTNSSTEDVVITPSDQMRFSSPDGQYFIPKLGSTDDYYGGQITVKALSSTRRTLMAEVPTDLMKLKLVYGLDLTHPSGSFDIDMDAKTLK